MGWDNDWQLSGLFLAAGLGFVLGLVFDLLRVLRALTHPSAAAVFWQDVLFCVGGATAFFFFLLPITGGTVRGYLLLGTAVGFAVYLGTFGRFLVSLCQKASRVWGRLTAPLRRAGARLLAGIGTVFVRITAPLRGCGKICLKKVGIFIKKVLHVAD